MTNQQALIRYIGDTLSEGDDRYVVSNTGRDGEIRALRQLYKDKIMEITGLQENHAVQQLMAALESVGLLTIMSSTLTYGSSQYSAVGLTEGGWNVYRSLPPAP
ncbi:MAG: hypothetical protein J4F42_16050 [Desulfurellaceae bacterium]|nr:hypothetical protein [Desulfurellaceae bacterium]